MTIMIKNYSSIPRIATVYRQKGLSKFEGHEIALINDDMLSFMSDGLSFDLGGKKDKTCDSLSDGDIITVSNRGVICKLYDNAEHDATVYMTGKCNSNCIMCPCSDFERKTDDGIPDEWLEEFIAMLPEDIYHIVVTGGEPTLRTTRFFSVMSHLAMRFPNTEVLLLTNGRSFASIELFHRLLANCPPFLTVAIPLHGDNATLHDAITRTPGSFHQTCRGILNVLANRVAVELRVVVSKLNVEHLADIARFIVNRFPGVLTVNFIGLETMGNCAKNFKQVYISCSESWMYVKKAVRILMKNGIMAQLYNYPLCSVEKGYWYICRQSISPYKVRYAPECVNCIMKGQCSGFFYSTLNLAKPTVTPIQ